MWSAPIGWHPRINEFVARRLENAGRWREAAHQYELAARGTEARAQAMIRRKAYLREHGFMAKPHDFVSWEDRVLNVAGWQRAIDRLVERAEHAAAMALELDGPTAVSDRYPARPTAVALGCNYPNPFNAATVIPYQLPQAAPVRLTVFNVVGQPVRTLVDQHQPAGVHQAVWDGTDDRGRPAASGVYFYRLETAHHTRTRRMVSIR